MIQKEAVYVSDSNIGKGVFAERDFSPGEFILVFRGNRYDWGNPIHLTQTGANLLQTGYRTYIMPEFPSIFVNHNCNPNAGIVNNRTLVAIRPIGKGQEITFDYSTTMDENFWTLDCLCHDTSCRGVVKDFVTIPADLQHKYISMNIVQRFIAYRVRKKHSLNNH